MHLLNGQGATLTSALINKLKTMVLVPTKSHRNAWISLQAYNFIASQGFSRTIYTAPPGHQSIHQITTLPIFPDKYVDGDLIWNVLEEWPDDIILLTNGRDYATLIDYVLDPQIASSEADTETLQDR